MEKSKLTSFLLSGYESVIKTETLKEIEKKVSELEVKNESNSFSEFANKLNSEIPETNVLHDYFIRTKLSLIETHIKTIKYIIVIIIILSVVTGIVTALNSII